MDEDRARLHPDGKWIGNTLRKPTSAGHDHGQSGPGVEFAGKEAKVNIAWNTDKRTVQIESTWCSKMLGLKLTQALKAWFAC